LWIVLAHQYGTDAKCAMFYGTETNDEQRAGGAGAGAPVSWQDTAPTHFTPPRRTSLF
jgi:hypothetical protein